MFSSFVFHIAVVFRSEWASLNWSAGTLLHLLHLLRLLRLPSTSSHALPVSFRDIHLTLPHSSPTSPGPLPFWNLAPLSAPAFLLRTPSPTSSCGLHLPSHIHLHSPSPVPGFPLTDTQSCTFTHICSHLDPLYLPIYSPWLRPKYPQACHHSPSQVTIITHSQ